MPYSVPNTIPSLSYRTAQSSVQYTYNCRCGACFRSPYLVAIQRPQTTVSTSSARSRVKRLFFYSSITLPSISYLLFFLGHPLPLFPALCFVSANSGPLRYSLTWKTPNRQASVPIYCHQLASCTGPFLFPSSYQDGPPILDPIRRFGLLPFFFIHDKTHEHKNKIKDDQARPSH